MRAMAVTVAVRSLSPSGPAAARGSAVASATSSSGTNGRVDMIGSPSSAGRPAFYDTWEPATRKWLRTLLVELRLVSGTEILMDSRTPAGSGARARRRRPRERRPRKAILSLLDPLIDRCLVGTGHLRHDPRG